ncbi:MAG: hypothetical protein ACXWC4_09765 [Telluria sp.]
MSSDKSDVVTVGIAISLAIWLGDSYIHRNEVTRYQLFCTTKWENGACSGRVENANKTVYKSDFEHQVVLSMSEGGQPVRMKTCAVWNEANWSCETQYEDGLFVAQRMNDGVYVEEGNTAWFTETKNLRQKWKDVSMTRWWLQKLLDRIF